jgi:hypothetical protein
MDGTAWRTSKIIMGNEWKNFDLGINIISLKISTDIYFNRCHLIAILSDSISSLYIAFKHVTLKNLP